MDVVDFEKLKPILKKYFIMYYGEEYKELIEKRIESIVAIFPYRIKDVNNDINNKLYKKKVELTLIFLRENGFNISSEEIEMVKKANHTRSLATNNEEINKLLDLYFDEKMYYEPINFDFRFIFDAEPTEFINKKKAKFFKKMGAQFTDYEAFINSEEASSIFRRNRKTKKIDSCFR